MTTEGAISGRVLTLRRPRLPVATVAGAAAVVVLAISGAHGWGERPAGRAARRPANGQLTWGSRPASLSARWTAERSAAPGPPRPGRQGPRQSAGRPPCRSPGTRG